MAKKPESSTGQRLVKISDPDNVPVVVVNNAAVTIHGSLVAVTLLTNRLNFDAHGALEVPDLIVAGRLRLDLDMAIKLHKKLDGMINLLSPPKSGQAN